MAEQVRMVGCPGLAGKERRLHLNPHRGRREAAHVRRADAEEGVVGAVDQRAHARLEDRRSRASQDPGDLAEWEDAGMDRDVGVEEPHHVQVARPLGREVQLPKERLHAGDGPEIDPTRARVPTHECLHRRRRLGCRRIVEKVDEDRELGVVQAELVDDLEEAADGRVGGVYRRRAQPTGLHAGRVCSARAASCGCAEVEARRRPGMRTVRRRRILLYDTYDFLPDACNAVMQW